MKSVFRARTFLLPGFSVSFFLGLLTVYSMQVSAEAVTTGSDKAAVVFTYSVLKSDSDTQSTLQTLNKNTLPLLIKKGATVYALWTPVRYPADAPFSGLVDNSVILMLAWPSNSKQIENLANIIHDTTTLSVVDTVSYEAIYLSDGVNVPVGDGFYVHRREHYSLESEAHAIKLSKEAWVTFEPTFNSRIVGLFRALDSSTFAKHLRIAWYDGFQGWKDSRQFSRDPESLKRFRERATIQIKGSGIAIATNRNL